MKINVVYQERNRKGIYRVEVPGEIAENNVLAMSVAVKEDGYNARCIVLRHDGYDRHTKPKYVVHTMCFPTPGNDVQVSFDHGTYCSGDDALQRAMDNFDKRSRSLLELSESPKAQLVNDLEDLIGELPEVLNLTGLRDMIDKMGDTTRKMFIKQFHELVDEYNS